ncbi:hypothetical protein [Stackebrandtia nassauensis]|uniref:Uncharacterized protein n=1 Tax=Stackebrandtia nassauensis (strain DSM 44728 / CIP 108903 / NRRL B-16338 / NBRC 102104 / LLR-40K-21) TaxID=446470 RepID=D3Q0A1_STANL|nr:hypothetical protein [Stackebrandtia nassauensis]ADD45630.1 hypothetical protein Snas_6004 [Stackebrandtia nassauensis DSM 44728]
MTVAGELTKLWKAGAYTLPEAAAQYGDAGQKSGWTTGFDESGFLRTSVSGRVTAPMGVDQPLEHTDLGKLQPQWTRLRDTLQNRIIHKTRANLVKAGEALMQIADDYADRDGRARDAIDREREQLDKIGPPVVPDAPTHTTPKPKDYYESPTGDDLVKPLPY